MSIDDKKKTVLEHIVGRIELPDGAYDKAAERYQDLGTWLSRDNSSVVQFDPHIFPQGSFRLGTAIRPVISNEEYDLDLACNLRAGISKDSHTQAQLKQLIGAELASYRDARGIQEELREKHRCWRLEYQDDLKFHMDIVPCIPAEEGVRSILEKSMISSGTATSLAAAVSQFTVSITDDRRSDYAYITRNWPISNPNGYAAWFEHEMRPHGAQLLEKAQVDAVPLFKRKTPLQRSIQLLKRHRDWMFRNDEELKPISIIITTLAANAYNGSDNIAFALAEILSGMATFISASKPRIPNPVDPGEDFADRWSMPESRKFDLEGNFRRWLSQAQIDFEVITSTLEVDRIAEQAERKLAVRVNVGDLEKSLGLHEVHSQGSSPKTHHIETATKPWSSK